MVEDRSKEQEKFKSTPEDEDRAYISLDQARALAIRIAQKARGDYGSQFQDVTMVFDVLDAEQTEDRYIVTLTLQPQGAFRPGREQFFIDSGGTMTARRVLTVPRRMNRHTVLRGALGLVVVAVLVAVVTMFTVGAGCTGRLVGVVLTTVTPNSSVEPIPINTPISPAGTVTPVTAQQATWDTLRQLTFAYWDALNSYDTEKTVSYLEENYRQKHRGEVENGINRMKMFGVKLGVSEESPPELKGANEAEMYLALKDPLGTRRILMRFASVEGVWQITFAEEVD